MNKIKIALLLAGSAVTISQLSSCAAIRRMKCNREYAAKKGMEDADAGRVSMPGRLEGNSCVDEYAPSEFSKDYNYGFEMRKNEICQGSMAANFGRTDGEAGASTRPTKTRLGLCENKKLEAIYESEFTKSYCAPARATKLGRERAQAWQISDFETAFADCKAGVKTLSQAYKVAYNDAMKTNCGSGEAEKFGLQEAIGRRDGSAGRIRFGNCTDGKEEALAAFEKTFHLHRERIAKEDEAAAIAAAHAARVSKENEFARNTATASFPFQLRNYVSRCQVAEDKSFVRVDVENAYPEQVLIQGNWRFQYYNNDFAKITEDRAAEAVLITGNNKKTFQKLTLPKDARFCRAEFIGQTGI